MVTGNGQQFGILILEGSKIIAHGAELTGAGAGEGKGIENDDDVLLTFKGRERNDLTVLVLE
jgi:hypothetical protein